MNDLRTVHCPACGKPMSELAPREGDTGTIPFRCAQCGVTYFTDDHVPVSGRANQTAT